MSFFFGMMNITPINKLPTSAIKGSPKIRMAKVLELNQSLFQKLYNEPKLLDKNTIKKDIEENIAQLTKTQPLNIDIKFSDNLYYARGRCDVNYDTDTNEYIYSITLRNGKNGIFNPEDLTTIMHEVTHLHDYLLNPKKINKKISLLSDNSFIKLLLKGLQHYIVYKNMFYKRESDCFFDKSFAKLKLKLLTIFQTPLEKLDNLELCRYRLMSEEIAYQECEKYAGILEKQGHKAFRSPTTTDNACFKEKIEFLEDEIRKLQKAIREKYRNE